MKAYQKKKESQLKIARERIKILFQKAKESSKEQPALADRYVKIAIKIAQKFKIKLGKYKRRFCKHCHTHFIPGQNLRVRLQQGKQGHIVYTCLKCQKYMKFPYHPKKTH